MRLPEEQIKQAILHPELPVRTLALQYFTHSFSENTTVMPLVIKVIEMYGRELSIPLIREGASLPQPMQFKLETNATKLPKFNQSLRDVMACE